MSHSTTLWIELKVKCLDAVRHQQQKYVSQASLLKLALRQSKFKGIILVSFVAYWILYALSSGMFFYYKVDITPLLKTSPVPNPYFIVSFVNFPSLYNSGMIWFPNGHLQINLLYGATIFSVLLAALFALNMLLLSYSSHLGGLSKRQGTSGLLGMVPALFSGGCCSIPFGLLLIGTIAPTAALSTFAYTYPVLTNIFFAVLMLFSIVYTSQKISRLCLTRNSTQGGLQGVSEVWPKSDEI